MAESVRRGEAGCGVMRWGSSSVKRSRTASKMAELTASSKACCRALLMLALTVDLATALTTLALAAEEM
jgi:hypothetical protein